MSKSEKPQARDIITILNNPSDKSKLQNFIDESVRCRIRIRAENEANKALREEAFTQLGCEPKIYNQLVRLFDDNSFEEKKNEIETLEAAIDLLTGRSN